MLDQAPEEEVGVYGDRYCAFVDILGFRQLIDRLSTESSQFEALRTLLARVHGAKSGGASEQQSDFRAQSISDAVAISTLPTPSGLADIFNALELLAVDLLVEGYFIRGAVVRAPLYHDDKMVFGRALVQAYSLESEVVKFPRIMVARNVRDDIIRFSADSKLRVNSPDAKCLLQSLDGPMYLDILGPVVSLLKKNEHPFQKLTPEEKVRHRKYLGIRERIQQRYEESMDSPRHFEKVRWFAQYWNKAIPNELNLRIRDADRTF
ncbi:hypothetical protein C7U92_27960 [Bradyrhizobium sp. WBOS7]|uniref:Uncharacterized protein n=1 Tax=Bradyrhizobium betae TaxID=244734 RepID=A0AAE9NAK7_9BRAD|nr:MULTISPECIES: hypothetical protein [Bradyrhizobium]MDD1574493.1 hypothetical protein [Bradyrhizobium sp. WBOS1]UUO35543.1 hypothetical protein DCK84_13875 [Bradyrhizobium sp. WBOS01]MDD1529636.1 hypothetical protein [Bradyrhizobium sp. WBOS2]MDD1580529.1 hypothetical protein [Bradyrhizobium sp. WBOS7]MDD1604214.1 hypothetical protein [Bradyrhizobium sp. WBOS16]